MATLSFLDFMDFGRAFMSVRLSTVWNEDDRGGLPLRLAVPLRSIVQLGHFMSSNEVLCGPRRRVIW